jgi:hypothetical protein
MKQQMRRLRRMTGARLFAISAATSRGLSEVLRTLFGYIQEGQAMVAPLKDLEVSRS